MGNVLIVQNSIRTVYLFRLSYIRKLKEEGIKVTIVAPKDCIKSYALIRQEGIDIMSSCKMSNLIMTLISIIQMNLLILFCRIRYRNLTCVCHFLVTFLMCFLSLSIFNKRLVVVIEGLGSIFSNSPKRRAMLKKMLEFSSALRVFCNSDDMNLLGEVSSINMGGIGVEKHDYISSMPRENEPFRLLFVGRLIGDKGVFDVIESFRIVKNVVPNVTLSLVGDIYTANPSSISQEQIIKLKEEFGDSIDFVGFTHDVSKWYLSSHILLLPSKREGYPVCVMEANMCGLPAICYDVAGCNEAVQSGVNGLLAEKGNIRDFVSNILMLLETNKLSHMSSTSKEYALKFFDKDKKSEDFISILNRI